jgi:hypothetical protein
MGQQATCTLKFAGKTLEGTAWLEHKDLVFRGPERLAIPLKDITSATAEDGRLRVTFAGKRADFDIGPEAPKWANRITNPPSRLEKLGIKPGLTVFRVNFKDDEFAGEVRARGAKIVRTAPAGGVDAIFLGASKREDLARLAAAVRSLKPNGAVWIVRPKGTKAITEAETMAAGKRAGLVDVKVVSYSETHTAEKFVIPLSARR